MVNIRAVTRSLSLPLAPLFAMLALALWLWAGIESLDHHHDQDADCAACATATLPSDIVIELPPAVVVSSGTWAFSDLSPAPFDHGEVATRARDPPHLS